MASPENAIAAAVTPRRTQASCTKCRTSRRLRNGLCLSCLFGELSSLERLDAKKFGASLTKVGQSRTRQVFPGYQLLETIGRGGMGIIYRAREIASGRLVAIKSVSAESSDEVLARFRREAETAANLDHRNIIPIYSVGEAKDGRPFVVMKLASSNLREQVESFRKNPKEAVTVIVKVARALHFAHTRGILHRDIKPANILLDDHGEPLVADFGLAKTTSEVEGLSRTLFVYGTVGYLAPEQAQGSKVRLTPAVDIYALGTILFELLAGRPPYAGEGILSFLQEAAKDDPPRLRKFAPKADRNLEAICLRCLRFEPGDRFGSAEELAEELERWTNHTPIRTKSLGIEIRAVRWIARNPKLAFGTAALSLFCFWLVARAHNSASELRETILADRSTAVLPFLRISERELKIEDVSGSAKSISSEFGRQSSIHAIPVPISDSPGTYGSWEQITKVTRAITARTILTGVRRDLGSNERITFRMVDASSGKLILIKVWEGDKSLTGKAVKEFAASVHQAIAGSRKPEMTASERDPGMENTEAKEAILAGRNLMSHYTIVDLDRAIALFRKAIDIEPKSFVAHTELSFAAAGRTHYVEDRSYLNLARIESETALKLAPTWGDARRALASVLYQEGRFTEALEQSLQAVEISGVQKRSARLVGITLDSLGRLDDALFWLSLAARAEGVPGEVECHIGDCWTKLGNDEQALAAYRRTELMQPSWPNGELGIRHLRMLEGDFDLARVFDKEGDQVRGAVADERAMTAQVEFFSRNFETAVRLYEKLNSVDPGGGGTFYGAVSYSSALGRAKQGMGDKGSGDEILRQALLAEVSLAARKNHNPEGLYRLAAIESCLDMIEESGKDLSMAVESGWTDRRSLTMDPRFDNVRSTALFLAIDDKLKFKLKEMNKRLSNTELVRSMKWTKKIGMN